MIPVRRVLIYGGPMQLAYRTEVGHVRRRNEDAVLARPERGVVAVADGLGGHAAGDVASLTVVRSLDEAPLSPASSAQDLIDAATAAHRAVVAAAADPERHGMGSTLVLAVLGGATARILHVGDSRAYLLEADGRLRRLTQDHSVHGYLTQALGLDRDLVPDVVEADCSAGSRLLLCTDGLTNMVEDGDIAGLLGRGDAQEACDALVDTALLAGGVDNVTVAVVVF